MRAITKTNLRNLTILLGSSLTVLAATLLAPALPGMAEAFQDVPNDELLVRLTLTMPALFIAIGAPLAGLLLDRWGRKPVIVAALMLYGLAGTSGFILDSLYSVLVGRALLGLATAGVMSGFTTLIADYFSGQKLNQYMGYRGAFNGFGGMVFLILGGYLADINWHYTFLVHLFAFVILPGTVFTVDEPLLQTKDQYQATPGSRDAFPLRTVALIYAVSLVSMILFFTFPVQLPFYLTSQAGASNSQVGLALSLQTVVSGVASLQYQRLKAKFSFQAILALAFLTLGMNLVIVALTAVYSLVMVGLLIGGLAVGWLLVNLNVWVAAITPPVLRGRTVGGLTTAIFLGQFLSPILTQPIIKQVGVAGTFGVAGGVSLLLTVIFAATSFRQHPS